MRSSEKIGWFLNFTTPSWITIFGGASAVLAIILFGLHFYSIAVGLLILSFLTDWFDGCLARYQQGDKPVMTPEEETHLTLWNIINYRGVTNFGRALDPLVDKVRFLGLLWTVGTDHVDRGVAILITILAAILTVIRPIKLRLKLGNAGANRWGKYKVYAEVVFVAILVFSTQPLFHRENPLTALSLTHTVINLSATIAMILACASLYTHIENGYIYYRYGRNS
ncbi:CDP-alcohol phosphatidyltransferase family protein [Candidatus Uhrbacteria bacterium]|nr:CDP-alcohol phosphatidyltransferase family protein [Candidatus Uhrbacteria bacterium]